MKRFFFFILILCCGFALAAQEKYKSINGNVVTSDSLKPIPYAHIISEMSLFGAVSDLDGNFKIMVHPIDTLRIISVGFVTKEVPVNYERFIRDTLFIVLQHDTIMLKEVEIRPLPDYKTFKKMFAEMPTRGPMILSGINDHVSLDFFYKEPSKLPPPALGPVQLIYNKFNDKAVRDRRLLRNRRKMNKILIKEGKGDSLLPLEIEFRR